MTAVLSWQEERSVAGAWARARAGAAQARTAAAARPAPVRTRRPGTAAAVASLSAKYTNIKFTSLTQSHIKPNSPSSEILSSF